MSLQRMDAPELIALITRHRRLIHKVAYAYCRNASDREDLVQEIAIQLWRARDRYDPRYRETTWIYRIALNVAISAYRRARRHAASLPLELAVTLAEPAAPTGDLALLLACIAELGPLDRALVLLYLDDNDHAQIADVLGLSVTNVGTRLGRIKDRLRAAFARHSQEGGPDGAR
jgi:RNA polymerase sigma-70 factor (ECF subfamily)